MHQHRPDSSSATARQQPKSRAAPLSPIRSRGRGGFRARGVRAGAHPVWARSPRRRMEPRALASSTGGDTSAPGAAVHRCLHLHGVSVWYPMERKGPQALTGPELNAAVYRYLQESGFVHTAFNFFCEAGIEKGNIQGMIPQDALIRIVHKGLQCIELEANSEIGSDDEYHFFDTLDLMTNDLDELRKKITGSAKCDSVKNDNEQNIDSVETEKEHKIDSVEADKAQKIYSVETDRAQKIGSGETTKMSRKKPIWKMKAVQNNNPDETAAMWN